MATKSKTAPILTVSVAAQLAGMHPQTLRQYDRLGLVVAKRTRGGGRRYSLNDVEKLIEVQRLSQEEGINLSGIARIIELQDEVSKLRTAHQNLRKKFEKLELFTQFLSAELDRRNSRENRVFAANSAGDVTMAERIDLLRRALRNIDQRIDTDNDDARDVVLWRPRNMVLFTSQQRHQ